MSSGYDHYDASEDAANDIDESRYCEDCKWLTEAVRDLEQQRREAIDQRNRELGFPVRSEEVFLSKMRTLEHRRNSALDVLAKHQQLEHQ